MELIGTAISPANLENIRTQQNNILIFQIEKITEKILCKDLYVYYRKGI